MYSVLKNKAQIPSKVGLGGVGYGGHGYGYGYNMKIKVRFLVGALVLLGLVWYTYKQFEMSTTSVNLDKSSSYRAVKDKLKQAQAGNDVNVDRINMNELFHVGKCLLGLAGEKVVEIRRQTNANIGMNHKVKDNSVVTRADLESHQIIVHTLNHRFKTLRVVSEESNTPATSGGEEEEEAAKFDVEFYSAKCDDYVANFDDDFVEASRVKVFIDPLDATQEYSENLVEYVTVMFCIVIDGEPRAGIIHSPFKNSTVSSFLNEEDEDVGDDDDEEDGDDQDAANDDSEVPVPKKPRIIVSRSHTGTAKAIIEKNLPESELVIAAGSGFKTLQLLSNRADLYLHTSNIYKWDICAPNAILNARGGELTDRSGVKVDYQSNDLEMVPVADGIIAALDNHDTYLGVFKKE